MTVIVYWCRCCCRQAFKAGEQWTIEGPRISKHRMYVQIVCTRCFHLARLKGVDLTSGALYR